MKIKDSVLKAMIDELFSQFINYTRYEESYDYTESWKSLLRVDNMINSDYFKDIAPEVKSELEELVNEATYEYQRQGFIQGFIEALKAFEESKEYEYNGPEVTQKQPEPEPEKDENNTPVIVKVK